MIKKLLIKCLLWLLSSLEDGKITQQEVSELIKTIKDITIKKEEK